MKPDAIRALVDRTPFAARPSGPRAVQKVGCRAGQARIIGDGRRLAEDGHPPVGIVRAPLVSLSIELPRQSGAERFGQLLPGFDRVTPHEKLQRVGTDALVARERVEEAIGQPVERRPVETVENVENVEILEIVRIVAIRFPHPARAAILQL